MAIKMNCPFCNRILNVTEKAFGKTVPCPNCNKPISVSYPTGPASSETSPIPPPAWSNAASDAAPASAPTGSLPPNMPPMPEENKPSGESALTQFFDEICGGVPENASTSRTSDELQVSQSNTTFSTAGSPQRPVGLVCLVFYWILAGVFGLIYGIASSVAVGVMYCGPEATNAFRSEMRMGTALGLAIMEFLVVLLFCWGFIMLVTAYGLWSSQRWGLSLAKPLAAINIILSLIGLIVSIIARTGIVMNLAGFAVAVIILVYLFGTASFMDRLQRTRSHLETGR